ncbi:uncharacterized protein TNCV_462501 [Trichonephila clavipes]|nr:uncharacterized protein TNCV_462501 [Trichonephila clavipes]
MTVENFVVKRSPFPSQDMPIHRIAKNMGKIESTRNSASTTSSKEGHCLVWFIIETYFFEEAIAFGAMAVTVTGQRYECFLRTHVIQDLQQRGFLDRIIFMQDDVSLHIANPVKQLLKRHFGIARVFCRHFSTAWQPQSPDLNSRDF